MFSMRVTRTLSHRIFSGYLGWCFFKELLGTFDGILVTNHHGAYNDYAADKHQYCWTYIIRNLEKIAQRHGRAGEDGQKLLRIASAMVVVTTSADIKGFQ